MTFTYESAELLEKGYSIIHSTLLEHEKQLPEYAPKCDPTTDPIKFSYGNPMTVPQWTETE